MSTRTGWAVGLACLFAAGGWATAVAVHAHQQMQWLFRSSTRSHIDLGRRLADLGQSPPSVSSPEPPSALADVLFGAQQGLTVLALSLLGVALVSIGRRVWAFGVIAAVAVLPAAVEGMTLAGEVLSPVDLSSQQQASWPWPEVVLQLAVIACPVVIAASVLRRQPVSIRPTPSAAFAALVVVGAGLVWVVVDSAGLAFDIRPSLTAAGTWCLVAVAVGLVSARATRHRLLAWGALASGLLGAQAVLSSGALAPTPRPSLNAGELLLRVAVVAAATALVLLLPQLRRVRARHSPASVVSGAG